jgi:hypothetical protein
MMVDNKIGSFIPHNRFFVDNAWSKDRGYGAFEISMFKEIPHYSFHFKLFFFDSTGD